ncbi:MAG: preprotein translocase subunit SecE [Pseudomonadales bacterium]|nr:preprotein translocase subunit SecE [Pseudomonadales bacterium]
MNEKTEVAQSKFDGAKWAIVFSLVGIAVIGNSYYGAEPLLYRVLSIIVVAFLAVWIGSLTSKGRSFIELLKEARVETRKVVWPSRQETTQTTMVVVVVVLIASLILWALDSFLGWIVSSLIG